MLPVSVADVFKSNILIILCYITGYIILSSDKYLNTYRKCLVDSSDFQDDVLISIELLTACSAFHDFIQLLCCLVHISMWRQQCQEGKSSTQASRFVNLQGLQVQNIFHICVIP